MKIYSPCLDCPDRHPVCHGTCEKYKKYRKELDEYNETAKKARERDRPLKSRSKRMEKFFNVQLRKGEIRH